MVLVKGLQKTSLIDFPPYTAAVVFLGGCNFRCRFCHNPELVLRFNDIPTISEKELFGFLEGRKKWIDGVCVTGGEPCIYPDLCEFVKRIKEIGFLVKLDTNGTNPEMLKRLIDGGLVDYIAMDIKAPLEIYDDVCGVDVVKENIEESAEMIKKSKVEHEFRTTVVPGLIGKKEIFLIGKWLNGSKRYAIQNFRGTRELIDKELQGTMGYTKEELGEMKKIAEAYFEEVVVRE